MFAALRRLGIQRGRALSAQCLILKPPVRSAARCSMRALCGLPPLSYEDKFISGILSNTKTIAMVGASPKWSRPSYFAMKYLQAKGFRVIPVNPVAAGNQILGEHVYADLEQLQTAVHEGSIPPVDMVDIFRNSEDAALITDMVLQSMPQVKCVWMQLGVYNPQAAEKAQAAGVDVVMNRCPKIEFSRLFGELGWHGFNSGVISSKRARDTAPTSTFTGFETKAIHAGSRPDPATGARSTPIFQTTSYVFDDADHAASLFNLQTFGNIYSRLSNPTTAVLEEKIASLEGARGATCTASGHSAQLVALFALMEPGDVLISSDKLYGGSITQFGKTVQKFGWDCEFVNVDDVRAVGAALGRHGAKAKAVWCESLANPGVGVRARAVSVVQVGWCQTCRRSPLWRTSTVCH